MKPRSKILIIAGSDSSGGAGIQADIKTITSLGSYAMTAITAITSQNTLGVKSVAKVHPNEIKKQILFTCNDIEPDAVKIGMLHNSNVINIVANSLRKIKTKKVILDPVMVAKGGAKLINDNAIKTLKLKLIKKVLLLTPNIPEAEVLSGIKIKVPNDMINAAKIICKQGARNVLIKGGHKKTKILKDIYLGEMGLKIFENKKIKTKNTHGTGCTLSSAITTFLSCGKPLKKSCELGIKYVNQSIKSNLNYGKGHGPINHLNSIKLNRKFL